MIGNLKGLNKGFGKLQIVLFTLTLFVIPVTLQNQELQSAGLSQSDQVVYQTDNSNVKISQTQKQRTKQQQSVSQFYANNKLSQQLSQFSFEIQNTQQFHFDLGTDHLIHFLMRIYVLKDNVYSQVQDVLNEAALSVVVYENNHKIVAQKSFYFSDYISVDGKKGNSYMIRFYTNSHKLVIVNHNRFVHGTQFTNKIVNDKMKDVGDRLSSTNNKLNYIFKVLRTTYRVEFEERLLITQKFATFSKFQILEIVILVALCLVQTKMVSRMFSRQSIV